MQVTITVAVRDDDGTTHSVEVVERSERFGDHDDHPARLVASRAMSRARKALDRLVPPSTRP
jgi:hypothetical protein